MLTLKLALRNIFRHRSRSLVTFSAIAFGSFALIFSSGFFEDVYVKLTEAEINLRTGHLQIAREGYFDFGAGQPYDLLVDNPNALADEIKQISAVRSVSSRLYLNALLSTGENAVSGFAEGIVPGQQKVSPDREHRMRRSDLKNAALVLTEGTDIEADNDLIIGHGLAQALSVNVGDDIILLTRTVDDSINGSDVKVRGIFQSGMEDFDNYGMRIPLSTAQNLIRSPNSAHLLIVKLQDTSQTDAVLKTLREKFKDRGLEIRSWKELSDFSIKTKILFQRWFIVLKFIITIIVLLSIYNTMNMAVLERTTEIGTLRAMGSRRHEIIRLFLLEGLLVGCIGGFTGAAAGAALTKMIAVIGIVMPPAPGATIPWLCEPMIVPSTLLFTFLLSVATSVFSAWIPARRAAKAEIAQALRFAL